MLSCVFVCDFLFCFRLDCVQRIDPCDIEQWQVQNTVQSKRKGQAEDKGANGI